MRTVLCAGIVLAMLMPAEAGDWGGYASLGVGLAPDYLGSKYYMVVPYAEARLNDGNYYARFEGNTLRFNLVDDDHFHMGPLVGLRYGRGDTDCPSVWHMRHVDDSGTAGAFIEYENVGKDPRYGQTVTLSAREGVIGNGDGLSIGLSANARAPVNFIDRGLIASIEGDISWADAPYMHAFFDVTPTDALASGLPPFRAEAGFTSAGIALSLDQFFSRHWSAGLRFHYAQMLGDAGSSPVTAIAGSRDQYFVGIVGGYAL